MKKVTRSAALIIMTFALVFTGVFSAGGLQVSASDRGDIPSKVSRVVLPDKAANKFYLPDNYKYKTDKCKTSKKSVADVRGKSKPYIKIKKAGKAELTIYARKGSSGKYRKYETAVTAYDYTNPFKTYKVGRKSFRKYYKSATNYGMSGGIKGKVNIKAAEGWKVVRIEKMGSDDDDYVTISNGSYVDIPQMGELRVTMKHKASRQKIVFGNVVM